MKYLVTISLLLSAHASAKEGNLDLELASKRSDQRATLQHRELEGKSKSSKNNSKKGGIFHTSKASKSGGGGAKSNKGSAKSSKGSANSNDKMAVEFDSDNFPGLKLAENEFGFDLKKEEVLAVNQQLRNNAGITDYTGGLAAFTVTAMALFLN